MPRRRSLRTTTGYLPPLPNASLPTAPMLLTYSAPFTSYCGLLRGFQTIGGEGIIRGFVAAVLKAVLYSVLYSVECVYVSRFGNYSGGIRDMGGECLTHCTHAV